jgi:hypothetical protein
MTATRPLFWSSVRLAAAVLASVSLCGLAVAAVGAGPCTRARLEFRFADPPRRPGAALDVAATNLRLAAAALLAAWAVQRRSALRAPLDCALGVMAGVNLALVEVALGAYRGRLLESVALHSPLELAAFSVCGATTSPPASAT